MDSALVLFHRLSMQSIVLYDVVHMTMDLKKGCQDHDYR